MKKLWIWIGVVLFGWLSMLTIGVSLAQQPQPQEEAETQGGLAAEAALAAAIPIQGRLTNSAGNPLNGSHQLRFRLYDVATGGTHLCESTQTVWVDEGLFNTAIPLVDLADPAHSCFLYIDGRQLYLGITVGSDAEMTPRQAILPVPYAWSLRPGAVIKGATSYLFVPGSAFVKDTNTDSTRWDIMGSAARIWRGSTAGSKYIYIPITIPAVLYGQAVRVSSIRVYYKCENGTNNYIDETKLFVYDESDPNLYKELVNDTENRQSNTPTSYTISTDATYNTLSVNQGFLTLRLYLNFINDTDYIHFGGVRVTLATNYE